VTFGLPRINYLFLALQDYLTIQASSVASERAFSSGTDLVTEWENYRNDSILEIPFKINDYDYND
jgi:hypothetical protein